MSDSQVISEEDRLNWLINKILMPGTSPDLVRHSALICGLIGIDEEELRGPGHVTLGHLFRVAIDKRIQTGATE